MRTTFKAKISILWKIRKEKCPELRKIQLISEPEAARPSVKGEVFEEKLEHDFKNQVRRKFHARFHDFR